MSKIKSVFGTYADKLQVMIDSSLDKFAPTWFQKFFDWGPIQTQLNFTSVIGRSRIEAAASIIARGSAAPLRARPGLDKLSGEIPAIAEKFVMREDDYRDFLTLQQINVDDAVKKQQLLDLMFADVKKSGDAAMKRLDIMCLEGISTGQISLTITNNPDGVVLANPIDLLMPSANKTNAAVNWGSSPTTATPITDIINTCETGRQRGIVFANIEMTMVLWLKFIKTTEVKDTIGNWLNLKNTNKVLPTLDNVNAFLEANKLPTIEIVEEVIGIEKDGSISTIRPFSDTNAVFIPAGKLGLIKNAIPIEKLRPVASVSYGDFNRALISKWQENEPFAEYTKVELNAFPAIEAIDSVYLLSTTLAY